MSPNPISVTRLALARHWLHAGGIIAYPTEAVYGLGCDPRNGAAVKRLLAMKQRPQHKGLILIADRFEALAPYVHLLDAERMAEIRASWPGPNTWLLPARETTPNWLTGSHRTLAVRVTAHPLAAALCRAWGGALVSTSANLGSRPPARRALEVRWRLTMQPDLIVAGACAGSDRPSTIRDGLSGRLLRG